MRSYDQPLGGHTRSSSVRTEIGTLHAPKLVGEFESLAPRFALAKGGKAMVLADGHAYLMTGSQQLKQEPRRAVDEPWTGETLGAGVDPVRLLGWRSLPNQVAIVAIQQQKRMRTDDRVHLTRRSPKGKGDWRTSFGDFSVAAISHEDTVAVATDLYGWTRVPRQEARLVLVDQAPVPADNPRTILETTVPEPFLYDISAIAPGYAVISSPEVPLSRADFRISSPDNPLKRHAARVRGHLRSSTKWHTRLTRLDAKLNKLWHVDVPFSVRQPPIDGGEGRIYLVGDRIALVDKGTLRWTQPLQAQATASTNGVLAAATHRGLLLFLPNGHHLQEIKTPILTPPAIAEDGSIYFASARKLWHCARA